MAHETDSQCFDAVVGMHTSAYVTVKHIGWRLRLVGMPKVVVTPGVLSDETLKGWCLRQRVELARSSRIELTKQCS